MPEGDRPREKLLLRGVNNLSDTELLAILLRTGTKGKSAIQIAQQLMNDNENLSKLAYKSVDSLTKNAGIGRDKATTLVAAFEIARRIKYSDKLYKNKKITSPQDVAEIFIPMLGDELKEKFIIICLNSSNKITKFEVISVGSLNASVVHPREVFKVAIDNSSANVILLHNHPSGNPEPSNEDITITKKLVEAGRILEIQVFDHIIIAGNNFYSFVDKKII